MRKDLRVGRAFPCKLLAWLERGFITGSTGRELPLMPSGKYDLWRGDLDLTSPVENSLDRDLRSFLSVFASSGAGVRATVRAMASLEEFYQLLSFSNRSAVFAMRSNSCEHLLEGLTAIAAVDASRADFRDILWALSLLYHAAETIGLDVGRTFEEAASLADSKTAGLIAGFLQRSPESKNLRRSWGYDEIDTEAGPGFIGWGSCSYDPTYDFKTLAFKISRLIASDRYQPEFVQVATDLPAVWLRTTDQQQQHVRDTALRTVRAGASVSAKLRPGYHPKNDVQMLTIFLVECADEQSANVLLHLTPNDKLRPARLAMMDRSLFCLVAARSIMGGIEDFETSETLARFSEPLTTLLRGAMRLTRRLPS